MPRPKVDTSVTYRVEPTAPQVSKAIEVKQVDAFGEVTTTARTLEPEAYRPNDSLVDAVNLAIALGRPLLLQGEPGCGKTRLAYSVAYELGLPLEKAAVKSTSHAQDLLYSYDAVTRLYDAQLGEKSTKVDGKPRFEDIRNYITLRPLGKAIAAAPHNQRSIVLIDEIDKADIDFPNDLLWELDRMEFEVAEEPGIQFGAGVESGDAQATRPIVIITHNEEKALPDAFLRRCVFHYIEFPEDSLEEILKLHRLENETLGKKAVDVVLSLRKRDELTKKPGISELLDWVGYLEAVNATDDELKSLSYLGALLKSKQDMSRVQTK